MLLQDMYLKQFIQQTASKEPVPGGGSVSAMCAATGAALCQMVAGLTVGKKGYEAHGEKMSQIIEQMQEQISLFLNAIDEDSASFDCVMEAMRLPKSTDEEKAERRKAISQATKKAAQVPLSLAQNTEKLFEICRYLALNGNKNASSDVCVATMLLRTAVLGALYNVKINLSGLAQDEFYTQTKAQIEQIEQNTIALEGEILSLINL